MNSWKPDNNRPASWMFRCPLCNEKVYFLTGMNSGNNRVKECRYIFCPWCGKRIIKNERKDE